MFRFEELRETAIDAPAHLLGAAHGKVLADARDDLQRGPAAGEVPARVNVGIVGIDVPIPLPVACGDSGGWRRSGCDDMNQHGVACMHLWTEAETAIRRWPNGRRTPARRVGWRRRVPLPRLQEPVDGMGA